MKKIGLVLAGGGGRGAYQIGVWKALRATELDQYITSVSGTSVGGLNAALFIQNDLEKAESVWESISNRIILTPKIESAQGFKRLSLFERDGLKNIIDSNLDMSCFDNNKYNCWMTCLLKDKYSPQFESEEVCILPDGRKEVRKYVDDPREYFNLRFHNDEQRKQILLATSAIPFIFPKEEVDGHIFGDGGASIFGGDNVPVKPVYEIDKCDVILIVHLSRMDESVKRKTFPNIIPFEIFPKKDLGSVLDFSAEGAKVRIQQGYDENLGLFQNIREMMDSNQKYLQKLADIYARLARCIRQEKILEDQQRELLKENYRIRTMGNGK